MAADSINYLLRANKNVARKLFVEMLRRLGTTLNIQEHRYIGLGGLWFADFTLVHRELGLTDLTSIEMRQPQRASFNRPFECVTVEPGLSSSVLPKLDLGERPSIMWLDYDTDLSGPALDDIGTVTSEVAASSICLVTVQADIRQVKYQRGPDDERLTRLEALEQYAGDLTRFSLKEEDITRSAFPGLVSEVLINAFRHGLTEAGRNLRFQLLVNTAYADGPPMVTVGGLLYDDTMSPIEFDEHGAFPFWPPSADPGWIEVPNLTVREKAALDQLMPGDAVPTTEVVRNELGFELSQEKLAAYHRFYRQYPTFTEYAI